MSSTTRIMYGLVIKTWTLLVAAHAFEKIEPLLFTLNLILLRKRSRTLLMEDSVMDRKNFGDLPQEILEMIREKVMKSVSMEKEASELLYRRYHCNGTHDFESGRRHRAESHNTISKEEGWTELAGEYCEHCWEVVINQGCDLPRKSNLLAYYGLETTCSHTFDEGESYDLNDYYSAVSVPISIKRLDNEANQDQYEGSTKLLEFSTSAFDIDLFTANRKLEQLVVDWKLKVYGLNLDGSSEASDEDESKDAEVGEGKQEKEVTKIVPKWFIWNYTTKNC